MIITCEFCGERVYEHCERVTRICGNCLPEHGEEFEERWEAYMDEKYETREANSK